MLVLVIGALGVSGVLLMAYFVLAFDWQSQAFLGVLPSRTLEIDSNETFSDGRWPALDEGLEQGDQIVGINEIDFSGMPVADRVDALNDFLDASEPNAVVRVRFWREIEFLSDIPERAGCKAVPEASNLRECLLVMQLGEFPYGDFVGYFLLGWMAGLGLWLLGVVLMLRRWKNSVIQMAVLLLVTTAIFLAGRFDTVSTHKLTFAWFTATGLMAGGLVLFGLEFPYRFALVLRAPVWQWAPLMVGFALGLSSVALYHSTDVALVNGAFALALGVLIMGALIMAMLLLWRRTRSASPVVRNQSTLLLIGLIPGLGPILFEFFWGLISGQGPTRIYPIDTVLPVLFPLTAVYVVLQFRLLDADHIITQSVLYSALLGLLTISYALLAGGIALVIGRTFQDTALNPLLLLGGMFFTVVFFNMLRSAVQNTIDRTYYRSRRAYRNYLEQFAQNVTKAISLGDVDALIRKTLTETLAPDHVIMFVRDPVSYLYVPRAHPDNGQRPTDIIFSSESGLVNYLRERATDLNLDEGGPLPIDVVSDRARLAVLDAHSIVGLRGQRVLNGFLVLGPRQGGMSYVYEDMRFLGSLGDQIALALERAQAVDDLERRVRVQDVLSQVSRALNFAIDFDTLLELIYAQTLRVINAPCFYIALRDLYTDEMMFVFYNEGDERITTRERQRWRMGRDLISEISRTQQTIRTDDYVRESQMRDPGGALLNANLKAWMGVPLLADTGEGVLGVMVAATTEPGVMFNDEQQDLFWDIANLASSAIDKLQLFDKTEQRAAQLDAINRISSELASEMGDVDRLLSLITENAVQILNTEAGSLLLADEDSGDLEFRVVIGGNEELVGSRIPAGSGVVGVTVERKKSIIVNDPARDSRWYGDMRATAEREAIQAIEESLELPGDDGDFQTNAILSVPLLAQGGRAIGVLQMVNKRDGSIFVQEDADLLETFAGQAAIAIENARLFDMTDQQLAARVQELDTMQLIDQELNRTLNLQNVVDITMDWALRKSGATAGALFIVDREHNDLLIVASYGYPSHSPFFLPPSEQRTYALERGIVGRVIRSEQPSLVTDISIDPDYDPTLDGCVSQLTVPLRSANQVIGVVILESDQEGELDLLDLDFVARLAEHASTAIANAQLFQELQRANEAKSEFVSFVAHELKNPMTSMKGYTDLLLKGVVGPVNEQQSDFLTTIFNNVNRMETLVSDLNDLTKQQTDNLRLDIYPVDFRSVIFETIRAQQRQIEEKNQELVMEVPENLPQVMGDQNRLIQIMTNFVSNANKYTPPDGTITVRAEATRNHWDPQGPHQVVHCFIRDTGIGMAKEDLDQLFTPYFRSENPKTREQPGTGLGLTITRGLIEQHGGTIWVESELEVGTTFHFTIPVVVEEAAEQRA